MEGEEIEENTILFSLRHREAHVGAEGQQNPQVFGKGLHGEL